MRLKQVLVGVAGCGATAVFVTAVALAGRDDPTVVVRPSAPPPVSPVVVRQAAPMADLTAKVRQRSVETVFRAHGVKRISTGGCTARSKLGCTSYDGLRRGTVEGLLAFREASGCELTVSGGTERGHATMRFSHGNGYKIDIMPTKCVNRYIRKTMKKVGERGDGSDLYRAKPGQLFADEHASHWDVLFGPEWCVKRQIRHRSCG